MDNEKFFDKYFNPDDESGFNEVLFEREKKINTIRARLENYKLPEKDINEAINIIIDAEIKMEKIKRNLNYKKCTQQDIEKMYNDLSKVVLQMKTEFNDKVSKMLKDNYMKAKKIVEKRNKK